MTQYRIPFTIVESGYVIFDSFEKAEAAYERLNNEHVTVEDLGGWVTYKEGSFDYSAPIAAEQ